MLRVILSCTRSGSTALLRCFENNPAVDAVFHQPIKSSYRQDGTFDYRFYALAEQEADRIFVAKETIGGFEEPETAFSPLPYSEVMQSIGKWPLSPETIADLDPLVLVRDPFQTWGSINRLNRYSADISRFYSPFEYFLESYEAVVRFLVDARARGLPVCCVTQEMLGHDPARILHELCERWAIPWTGSMVEWTLPYGVKTWYSDETKWRMTHDPRFRRSKESLEASPRYHYVPSTVSIDAGEERAIERELRSLYDDANAIAHTDFGQP